MKRFRHIYTLITSLLLIGAAGALSAGCDRLHEGIHPCPEGIRLRLYYDYNMKYADAFPSEVKNVSVFVFDHATGRPVEEVHTEVGEVREHEFEINLDHLGRGRYDFLVWCYGDCKDHFAVNPTDHPDRLPEHHTCLMSEDDYAPGHQSADIGRLFHGRLENVDCTAEQTVNTVEMPLVKNTNTVRLVLQHLNGEYLDPAKFDITLESDNGHMAHDNTLIDGHNRVYHPWDVTSGTTDMSRAFAITDSRTVTSASALVAEHTVGRLVPEKGVNLRVKNNDTGEDIINIPFIDYALLVKGNYNRPMDDQEYLDRQDEYNMVFFLDDGLRWINQYIYINSWRVVIQENEL